jgi:glycosyltransferase involved in cell wall biosynthesis
MTAPRVSVVINNHNYARYLGEAIDSALAQSYPRVEVVVVDDGSTDDSPAVIARYGGRVVPVLKGNGGMGSAVNAGFAASSGDLVIVLDADDALAPRAVERAVGAWRPGVAKVQWRLAVVDATGAPRGALAPAARIPLPSGDLRPLVASRFAYAFPPTSGNAYDRRVLGRLLPLDAAAWPLTADYYLNMLAPFYGDVVSIDEPLGRYRLHGSNHWVCFRPSLEERLERDVSQTLLVEQAVRELAGRAGLPVSEPLSLGDAYYAVLRLGLRVIEPARYPLPGESPLWLGAQGIRALWRWPAGRGLAGLRRRLGLAVWFALLPLLPRPAARQVAARTLRRRRAAQYRAARGAGTP